MATLAELVQEYTDLDEPIVAHLQRLVASWGVLSDLCFADLLLFAPTRGTSRRVRGPGPGAADDQPDPAPRGPGRAGLRGRRPSAAGPSLAARQRGGGRGRHPEARRARPAGVHPGALARPAGGPADPGVGPVGRPAARPARTGLRGGLRSTGPHDRPGRLPVSRRRASSPPRPLGSATECSCWIASARVEYASPNAVNALHRMGVVLRHRRHSSRRGRPRPVGGVAGLRVAAAGDRGDRRRERHHGGPAVHAPPRQRRP